MPEKILVIDDDDAVRDSLASILQSMGYEVVTASEGAEGLEKFRAHHPRLIMTDILMPGQEGIETIMEIRKLDPHVKIIAMSGGGRTNSQSFLQLAQKLGADCTLEKPFEFDDLEAVLTRCLN